MIELLMLGRNTWNHITEQIIYIKNSFLKLFTRDYYYLLEPI